jgi:NAD(P)-dependent dehydrogenase (short-subunit alcohol dehydrogenase family)
VSAADVGARVSGVLKGKVAVVTGANRGLGQAIALGLSRAGAMVAAAARDPASLEEVMRELPAQCLPVAGDVSSEDSMAELARTVLDHFGRADIIVANAGIAGPTLPLHEISLAEWRECLQVDLDGVFLTFRAFIPALIEQGEGNLIAISSMTGKRPLAGRTPYSAAKLGVVGLCRSLAVELGPHGIRVNSICPGAISGPRIRDVIRNQARLQGIDEETALGQFTSASPLRRLVEPDEVAQACVFLSSAAAAAITGEDLNVSAGVAMY